MTDTMEVSDNFDTLDTEIETARAEESNHPDVNEDGDGAPPVEEQQEAPPKDYAKIAEDKSRALKAERQKRRELEDRLQAFEARSTRENKVDPFAEVLAIDEDADPIGAIKAMKAAIKAEAELRQSQGQKDQATQQVQQIAQRMASFENEFRSDHEDYDKAAKFFADSRKAELEEAGLEGQELNQMLQQDLLGVTIRAMRSGRDPAEVVYNLAKRGGFGQEKAPAVDKAEKKLQTIERGQKAAKTLSGAKTGDGQITVEHLNSLDGAAFDAALAKFKEQSRRVA